MATAHGGKRSLDDESATLALAAHLLTLAPPFSRNKHFEAYRDPQFKRALALVRRIKALATDVDVALNKQMTVRVTDGVWAGKPARQLTIEGPGLRRTAWLSVGSFGLLQARCPRLQDPAVT